MTDAALPADKPTCIATTRAGLPCRRPPVRGGVYCVSHMGLNRDEQGAPHGNQNHRSHGFYSAVLEDDEIVDLAGLVDNQDLSGEIGLIRTLVRRITRYLNDSGKEFTVKDLATMVNLAYQGTRTVAHLIARNNGGASFADILEEALGDMDRLHERDEA